MDPEPTQLELTLGATHAGRTRRITPLGKAPPTISIETAQLLLAATNELAHAEPDTEHDRLVYGFERLADALDEVADSTKIDDVRRSAADLERDSRANARAEVVRRGLEDADRVLAQLEPASTDRARRALEVSNQATASIDPQRAVTAQCDTIGTAFRDTVRALFAASGSADLESP
jgi:hypothetical protein